jgi:hypothetical protein
MSPENLSRRAILAGAASVPALATLPAAALASTEPDPAFAAIDTHRQALLRKLAAGRHNFHLEQRDKGKKEADAAQDLAFAAEDDAQWELANVVPTTFAGVLALFAYLDDLYAGGVALPEDPSNWHSSEESDGLSSFADENMIDLFYDRPIELPLIFWITRNARTALQALAVQS